MGRYHWFEDRADRLRADGAAAAGAYGGWLYGDGSDGALTLHDGDVLSPGFYTDITIVAGATITLAPGLNRIPVIHCTGTWTINGSVDLRGVDAVGRLNASALANGQPSDTAQGTNISSALSGPFLGGNGGAGASGPTVYTAVPAVTDTSVLDWVRVLAWESRSDAYSLADVGLGGSGSGDGGANYGGAGGVGGRAFALAARHLAHGPDSSYLIGGGKGGDGGDDGTGVTGHGNCGGGGGGAGGWWLTVSDEIIGDTEVIGTGGAGGAGCGTGEDGQPGMTGRGIHLLNQGS